MTKIEILKTLGWDEKLISAFDLIEDTKDALPADIELSLEPPEAVTTDVTLNTASATLKTKITVSG